MARAYRTFDRGSKGKASTRLHDIVVIVVKIHRKKVCERIIMPITYYTDDGDSVDPSFWRSWNAHRPSAISHHCIEEFWNSATERDPRRYVQHHTYTSRYRMVGYGSHFLSNGSVTANGRQWERASVTF